MGIFDWITGKDAYDDASKEMDKYWQQAQQFGQQGFGYQQPFRRAGLEQTGRLNEAENSLLDPSALLAKWMQSYQMSPYAQKSLENAKESGLGAASSMGLMGSSAALNNIQNSAGDIMNADRQTYLNDLMNKYMQGIGIGQNIFNTGASTAGNMGNQAINLGNQALGVGGNQAQLAYNSAAAGPNFLKDLLAMGAKAAGNYFTGGA